MSRMLSQNMFIFGILPDSIMIIQDVCAMLVNGLGECCCIGFCPVSWICYWDFVLRVKILRNSAPVLSMKSIEMDIVHTKHV